jgi:hypothetical protein
MQGGAGHAVFAEPYTQDINPFLAESALPRGTWNTTLVPDMYAYRHKLAVRPSPTSSGPRY